MMRQFYCYFKRKKKQDIQDKYLFYILIRWFQAVAFLQLNLKSCGQGKSAVKNNTDALHSTSNSHQHIQLIRVS